MGERPPGARSAGEGVVFAGEATHESPATPIGSVRTLASTQAVVKLDPMVAERLDPGVGLVGRPGAANSQGRRVGRGGSLARTNWPMPSSTALISPLSWSCPSVSSRLRLSCDRGGLADLPRSRRGSARKLSSTPSARAAWSSRGIQQQAHARVHRGDGLVVVAEFSGAAFLATVGRGALQVAEDDVEDVDHIVAGAVGQHRGYRRSRWRGNDRGDVAGRGEQLVDSLGRGRELVGGAGASAAPAAALITPSLPAAAA